MDYFVELDQEEFEDYYWEFEVVLDFVDFEANYSVRAAEMMEFENSDQIEAFAVVESLVALAVHYN
jgi:hypothetical protein